MGDYGILPFYGVADLAPVRKLYHDVLGFEVYMDAHTCLVFRVNENSYLGFCTHMEMVQNPKSVMITVITDQVDHVSKILEDAGYPAYKKPGLYEKFNIYQAFHTDPSGYTLEIQKFL